MEADFVAAGGTRTPFEQTRPRGAISARVAVCRHRGAPEGDHLDLFIGPFDCRQPPHDDALVAHSWRLPLDAWLDRTTSAPAGLRVGQVLATATPPHRALYLSLATTRMLDNDRGTVEPLAHGDGWMLVEPQSPLDTRIDRCLAEFRWCGARNPADTLYRIELTRTDSAWRAAITHIETRANAETHEPAPVPPREKRS
ncbi:MAG: hypothetical protein RIR10_1015 [Planctomycetota bacterium]|jgi:hypothetical protein